MIAQYLVVDIVAHKVRKVLFARKNKIHITRSR